MKRVLAIFAVLAIFLGSCLVAAAQEFRCSVCGSNSHGSMWHDSDKDGVNDR